MPIRRDNFTQALRAISVCFLRVLIEMEWNL